jgi:hypothetical protein
MSIRLSSNEIEAANRAEASALLIRCGYRVYRPDADTEGEDLVLRSPAGRLIPVQLKGRITVDWDRYGGLPDIWMLFPDGPFQPNAHRAWYLIPHAALFEWMRRRHGHTPKWNGAWSSGSVSRIDRDFLEPYRIQHPRRH